MSVYALLDLPNSLVVFLYLIVIVKEIYADFLEEVMDRSLHGFVESAVNAVMH